MALKAVALGGLTVKDIEQVYLSPADATAAFSGGNIDAWVVWDPYFAIAQEHYNARVIADTSDRRLARLRRGDRWHAKGGRSRPRIKTSTGIIQKTVGLMQWVDETE